MSVYVDDMRRATRVTGRQSRMSHLLAEGRQAPLTRARPGLTGVRTPRRVTYMNTKQREIWTNTTKRGQVTYWYFSTRAFRAFRIARAEAERLLAAESAVLVDKPFWVGA